MTHITEDSISATRGRFSGQERAPLPLHSRDRSVRVGSKEKPESPWPQLKVLITGAGGFIGSHLCQRLCDEGTEVHATSRNERATTPGGPVWWQLDMADLAAARHAFAAIKPDIVYHLAGSVGASPSLDLVLPTYQSLLTSTVNVLLCATETNCRRVVLSGSFTEPAPGRAPPTPSSPYAAAKWAASGYGRMFHSLFHAPVVILQPFMVYGPAQAPNKLIPTVTLSLLKGEAPRLSSGRRTAGLGLRRRCDRGIPCGRREAWNRGSDN
jgi:UDP-glucose 4-epimerase